MSVEAVEGLMLLPEDAAIGASVRDVLDLDDHVFTTKPTPNRSDCLSLLGMGREVAAITGAPLKQIEIRPSSPAITDAVPVRIEAPRGCMLYCGRLVRGVDARARTPEWLIARLERSGIRAISAIVDITNYVMLELGQPLHAFDATRIAGSIRVRYAEEGEKLTLLNGETHALSASADNMIAGSTRARNVSTVAGGAAAGALIGRAVGGSGKGTLIGGLIGGAAATGAVASTKGYQVTVKEGTEVVFKVDKDTKLKL